jgi:anthranilate phosphoribosyltransferase
VRTLFNLIGPLANPARAPHQLIGVFAAKWLEPVATVLQQLGSQHVLVVHADDGLDEISLAAPTSVAELKNGQIRRYSISPERFGISRCKLDSLAVDSAAASLRIIESVFDNQVGPARDIVALNAGAAIYAADLSDSLDDGVARAFALIASGEAKHKWQAMIAYSQHAH